MTEKNGNKFWCADEPFKGMPGDTKVAIIYLETKDKTEEGHKEPPIVNTKNHRKEERIDRIRKWENNRTKERNERFRNAPSKGNIWSDTEDLLLLKHEMTYEEMAIKIGRSYAAVANRKCFLKKLEMGRGKEDQPKKDRKEYFKKYRKDNVKRLNKYSQDYRSKNLERKRELGRKQGKRRNIHWENAPARRSLWSEQDDLLLLKYDMPDAELAEKIGRSYSAVVMRRSTLKKLEKEINEQ